MQRSIIRVTHKRKIVQLVTLKEDLVHSGLLTMSVWDMSNKLTLAIALIAVVGVMTAVVSTDHVMAKKKHKSDDSSAFSRGAADAAKCAVQACGHLYITQPGKGFGDHSEKFNKNYINGACAAGMGGSDADEATFSCSRDNN
jgi:hypothetical protein